MNSIKSKDLHHRQFQQLVADIKAEYGGAKYFCVVWWLSRSEMLKKTYKLLEVTVSFVHMKDNIIPELNDTE